jgi:hypothetical protein
MNEHMNEQQNLSIVRAGYEAFGRGDIPGLLNLLDQQVSWVTPGPADLPSRGERTGHAAIAEFFQTLLGFVDITRFEPKEFVSQGERVVVIGDETCRVKATGRVVEIRWVHTFTVRNGKVTAFEEYGDFSAIASELRRSGASA